MTHSSQVSVTIPLEPPLDTVPRHWLLRMPIWGLWVAGLTLVASGVVLSLAWPVLAEKQAVERLRQSPGTMVIGGGPFVQFCSLASPQPPLEREVERWLGPGVWPVPNFWVFLRPEFPRARMNLLRSIRNISMLEVDCAGVNDGDLMLVCRRPELEALTLNSSDITADGLRGLSASGIQELSLNHPRYGREHIAAAIKTLPKLTDLNLCDSGVRDADLELLRDHPMLEGLNLSGTAISDAGLAVLTTLPRLKHLGFSGTQLSDAAISTIAKCSHLTTLDLSQTNITDAGLAQFPAAMTLSDLDIRDTGVTDAGLASLALDPESLDVSGSKVKLDEDALNWILSRKNLRDLGVANTELVPKAAKRIEESTSIVLGE
jgi:hypothetical protein